MDLSLEPSCAHGDLLNDSHPNTIWPSSSFSPSIDPPAALTGCINSMRYSPTNINRNSPVLASSLDTTSVASRCSVRVINEVVSRFGSEKKVLVESVGFGGLLEFPCLKQINLRFSSWLMSRVDEKSQSLLIPDGNRITFSKQDIGLVFGIPSIGRTILPKSSKQCSDNATLHPGSCHIDVKQYRSIKVVQAIIERRHDGPMSLTEQDQFKAAFVVFVMSTLFAPSGKHDRVSDDYMHIITRPEEISSFDWAEYVMRRLLEAVTKLKADLASNVKTPYIYGCPLFLQVLYLDSIDLGVLTMDHTIFPRVRCFTYDRLRVMIGADTSFSPPSPTETGLTNTVQLRSPVGICYSWAQSKLPVCPPSNHDCMLALWEASTRMTRVFKIPVEAAGPLFVAVNEFQRQISSVQFQCLLRSAIGSEALNFISLLLHIMEPYVNGFSYQPDTNPESPPHGICAYWQSHTRPNNYSHMQTKLNHHKRKSVNLDGAPTIFEFDNTCNQDCMHTSNSSPPEASSIPSGEHIDELLPIHDNSNRAIKVMARFFLSVRPEKPFRCTDLNCPPTSEDSLAYATQQHAKYISTAPPSPWDLGWNYEIDTDISVSFFTKIRSLQDSDEPWIAHYSPKYIEVRTSALKSQVLGISEMEMETVDAVIRRLKQSDDQLYTHHGPARWRHFVESDFMVSLLAGCFDISDPVVRSHFIGRHIRYDVTSCRIVFFPLIIQYRWACLAWRMQDNTIVVYDPLFSDRSHSLPLSHYERIAKLLKYTMTLMSENILKGWCIDWENARLKIFHHSDAPIPCKNRSAVLCLHFCRCFDGENIRPPLDTDRVDDITAMAIAELSSLHHNLGSVPANFR